MHTVDDTINLLERIFGQGEISKHGLEFAVVCPICNENHPGGVTKKKLAIRTDKLFCHCWSCEYVGKSLYSLIKTYFPSFLEEYKNLSKDNFLSMEEASEEKDTKIVELPTNAISLANHVFNKTQNLKRPEIVKQATTYLFNRGLEKTDFWKYLFYVASNPEGKLKIPVTRVYFPSFDSDGKLNFYVARRLDNKLWQRYINPAFASSKIVFNEYRIDWKKPIILVEGAFDMTKCPDNTMPLLGKKPNEHTRFLQKIIENSTPSVSVLLDSTAHKSAISLTRLLYESGVDKVCLASVPEGRKDPGESTKDEITQQLKTAMVIDKRTLLKLRIQSL